MSIVCSLESVYASNDEVGTLQRHWIAATEGCNKRQWWQWLDEMRSGHAGGWSRRWRKVEVVVWATALAGSDRRWGPLARSIAIGASRCKRRGIVEWVIVC
jgi:hypothetical protein